MGLFKRSHSALITASPSEAELAGVPMVGVVEREEQGDKIYENAAFTRSGEKGTRQAAVHRKHRRWHWQSSLPPDVSMVRLALEAIPRPDTLAPVWSRRGEGRVFQLASPQSP